jgi:hypothetical protein
VQELKEKVKIEIKPPTVVTLTAEDMLEEAVAEVLQEVFGRIAKEALIKMMADLSQHPERIALRDPKIINFCLLGLFGNGGKVLERMILLKLNENGFVEIDPYGDFLEELEKIGLGRR